MKKVVGVTLVLFLIAAVSLSAQPMRGKAGMFHKNIKEKLKLTPDQEKQFDDITYKQQQAAIDIRAKIQKNRLDLKKMISDKALDEGKILQITDDNSKLQAELKRGFIKHWLDIYKILNDDQKDIFMKGLAKMIDGGMMRGRMGMGMKPGMMGHGKGMGMMMHKGMKGDQSPQPEKNN